MATPRDFLTRVDDAILVQAGQLARLRGGTIRGAIADARETFVENAELTVDTEDNDIWRTRIDRCDVLLAREDDWLRRRANEAREHDR